MCDLICADIIYRMWGISLLAYMIMLLGILVSQSRWRTEYLIPTYNITVLDCYFNLTKKCNLFGRFRYDLIWLFDNLVMACFLGHPVLRHMIAAHIMIGFTKKWRCEVFASHSLSKLRPPMANAIGMSRDTSPSPSCREPARRSVANGNWRHTFVPLIQFDWWAGSVLQ